MLWHTALALCCGAGDLDVDPVGRERSGALPAARVRTVCNKPFAWIAVKYKDNRRIVRFFFSPTLTASTPLAPNGFLVCFLHPFPWF